MDDERLKEFRDLILEADRLLRVASDAARKMRLINEGDNLSLSHEVRMFAYEFSPKAEPKTPEHIILKGSGAVDNLLQSIWRAYDKTRPIDPPA